jgi:hypothetical protein
MQHSCHNIFEVYRCAMVCRFIALRVARSTNLRGRAYICRSSISRLHDNAGKNVSFHIILHISISFHIITSYLEGLIRALNIVHFANLMFDFNAARISRGEDNDHLGSRFKGGFEHFQDSPMHSSV